MKAEITGVRVFTEPDTGPDISWLDQKDAEMGEGFEAFAKERKAEAERGDWHMVYVVAEITINYPDGTYFDGSERTSTEIASCAVGGVESDSEDSHLRELGEQLLNDLRTMLEPGSPCVPVPCQGLDFDDKDIIWEI